MSLIKLERRHRHHAIILGIGWVLLVSGVVCLVTPLPGGLFIIAGLTILATKYVWSKRLLLKIPQWLNRLCGLKPNAHTAAFLWVKGCISKVKKIVAKY